MRTAPAFNQKLEESIGHLLLGMLFSDEDGAAAERHYTSAGQFYSRVGDHIGFSAIQSNLARLYLNQERYQRALLHTDSAIISGERAAVSGAQFGILPVAYQIRGATFKALCQMDSAWYYVEKGHALEMAYVQNSAREKIVEIDARYNIEQKTSQIAMQAKMLQSERERQYWLLAFILLALLSIVFLGFLYSRLQKSTRLVQLQSEQLTALDRAKSAFFANVTHELRTPLTLILGPVQSMLKGPDLTIQQTSLLQIIARTGKQMLQLVNEILDLTKLDKGQMGLDKQPTSVYSFFQTACAQFASMADQERINFNLEITVDPQLVLDIDQKKCRQILNNLLSNAFRFTPPGGTIRVKVHYNRGKLGIQVADSGKGIHPNDLPYVFDRYYQSEQPDRQSEGGTGIGLNLCKEYSKLLKGEIQVTSSLGKGSRFRLEFPARVSTVFESTTLVNDHESSQVKEDKLESLPFSNWLESEENTAAESRLPYILVVEDHLDLQQYIRLILSDRYRIAVASNGRVALDSLRQHSQLPDLILSDLMMPEMDGMQFLSALKGEDSTRHIPFIMLTARAEICSKLTALRTGVDDYLCKPFVEEELIARIANLLKHRTAALKERLDEKDGQTDGPLMSAPDRDWLEEFETFVSQHLEDDTLSIPRLASTFAMSESTFLRQLKRLTGLTPVQYIQEIRLDEARKLLELRECDTVSAAARQVGYADARTFSRSFKRRFGRLPSSYFDK